MSVTHVAGHGQAVGTHRSHAVNRFGSLQVGDRVTVHVIRRLGQTSYEVRLGYDRHIVESQAQLAAGQPVETRVISVGDQLELRQLPGSVASSEETGDKTEQDALLRLAQEYRLRLAPADVSLLRQMMIGADRTVTMAKAGLFLSRLGLPLQNDALAALYASQVSRPIEADPDQSEIGEEAVAFDAGALEDNQSAVSVLQSALPSDESELYSLPHFDSADAGDDPSRHRQFARWALNLQDGGSVQYRYGTLPLLVNGQLSEIDLAYFQDQHSARSEQSGRRLVLTLQTQCLGTVRISTESFGDHLAVELVSDSPAGIEHLGSHKVAFRELLGGMGWVVDSVAFRSADEITRASTEIVEHVLRNGSIDRCM